MELENAIALLRIAVKETDTNDTKHIDLTLVPAEDRFKYEEALKVSTTAIKEGKITRDEFLKRVHIS